MSWIVRWLFIGAWVVAAPLAAAQSRTSHIPIPSYRSAHPDEDYYPDVARRDNAQGIVVMAFTIGARGTVDKAAFISAAAPELQSGTLELLKSLRFTVPKGWQQSGGTEQRYTLLVNFRMITCHTDFPCNQSPEYKKGLPDPHAADIVLTVTSERPPPGRHLNDAEMRRLLRGESSR